MSKFLKIFILILFISIFVLNDFQIGYTESQHATANHSVFVEDDKDAKTQAIVEKPDDALEYIDLINWLKQSLNLKEMQIDQISYQNLTPEYRLYLISFVDSKTKAYLVLKNNLEIIEYGEGSYIPYLTNIICDEEIKELDIGKFLYFSPLENYWQYNFKNELVSIDGATGEWLPQISEPIASDNMVKHFNIHVVNISSKKASTEAIFDPYENMYWLLTNADSMTEQLTLEDIIDSLDTNQKIIYTGARYDGMVRFAYPIIGYQKIDEITYLALYDQYLDLMRYISYDELKQFGGFSIYQH